MRFATRFPDEIIKRREDLCKCSGGTRNKALHIDSFGLDKDPHSRLEEMEHALHLQIRVSIFLASR